MQLNREILALFAERARAGMVLLHELQNYATNIEIAHTSNGQRSIKYNLNYAKWI